MQPYKLRPRAEYSEQLCHSEERLLHTGRSSRKRSLKCQRNTDTFSIGQEVPCLAQPNVVSEGNKGKH